MSIIKTKINYNQIKINQQKNCYDCKEEVGLNFKVYSNKKFCNECYKSAVDICDFCKKEAKNEGDFFKARIEEDNMKIVMLCVECSSKLQACEHNNCNVYFKKSPNKKCDQCDAQFCLLHRIDHTCKVGEPRHLLRNASRTLYTGNAELAKEIKIPWLVGIELEAVNGDPNVLHNKLDQRVGMGHDGSLEGRQPIEMQLPPASNDKLEQLIKHTTRVARNAGYRVNKTCGMHTHFDMTADRGNAQFVFRILSTYYAIEPVIFAMLPASRKNNKYALPLRNWIGEAKMLELTRKPTPTISELEIMWYKSRTPDEALAFKNSMRNGQYDPNPSRYHGFNLHALFTKGTMEFRYHHGTLNKTKITNWVNLHLMILDWIKNRYDQNVIDAIFFCESPQDKFRLMCRHFNFSKVIRRYVMKNMRKFENAELEDRD